MPSIRLQPSRRLLLLYAAIHLVAAFSFLRSSLPPSAAWMAIVAIGASAVAAMRRERAKAGVELLLGDDGLIARRPGGNRMRDASAEEPVRVPLARDSTDFGWALWLQWRDAPAAGGDAGVGVALMLVPDNMPADDWRRLRAWLRHRAAAAISGVVS